MAGLLTVVVSLSGCSLFSIDPDEIDIADDTGDEAADEAGGTATEEGVGNDNEFDTGTSEGTGEATSGDTSGDPTSDGGNTTDEGTDTGGPMLCEAVDEVVVGENPVTIEAGTSNFVGSCGGSESETLYSFTVPADGDYSFSLAGADFSGVLYGLDDACVENPGSCSNTAEPILMALNGGDTVILVVDSDGGAGSATLVITGP